MIKNLAGTLALAVACGCSGSSYTSPTAMTTSCTPSATQICLTGSSFNPASLTVPSGTKVLWVNADPIAHTSTSSSVPTGGPTWNFSMAAGAKDSVTLSVAGTYQYYCTLHGTPTTGMHATITVQ